MIGTKVAPEFEIVGHPHNRKKVISKKIKFFVGICLLLLCIGLIFLFIGILADSGNKCNDMSKINGMHVLSYGPGDHSLNYRDYYCVDNLLIEIWGAGGCGSCLRSYIGGGSGAYIKTSISTGLRDIMIHVGHGGSGILGFEWTSASSSGCNVSFCNTTSDRDSWIKIGDDVHLVAGGGSDGCDDGDYTGGKGGTVSTKSKNNIIAIPGNSGIPMSDGGSAPFGGIGGRGSADFGEPGTIPGGGGGYIGDDCCPVYPATTRDLSKGADGMVNIYLTVSKD